jgi:uncharacterized membrane protein YraQ (UPF0718 family)
MDLISRIFVEAWHLLVDSSVYILIGLLMGGLLKAFLSPAYVARHLGKNRYRSVFKAAFLGIPLPLCSCGVVPAAAALKKQGANNGATTAFLISTPESGVDSIMVSYALLDPIMTIARPISAFLTAVIAGLLENLWNPPKKQDADIDASCPIDNCCSGEDCPPSEHARHHSRREKIGAGFRFAFLDLWPELAGWFFVGIFLAGIISALVPDNFLSLYLGGGLLSMLMMLGLGVPLYICASASTPIAAALILKGVSPGAALVLLLAGPATNITSLSMLPAILGKRGTVFYLLSIAVVSVGCGLLLDQVYALSGISPASVLGKAGDLIPVWFQISGVFVLLALSVKPLLQSIRYRLAGILHGKNIPAPNSGCGCDCDNHCDF